MQNKFGKNNVKIIVFEKFISSNQSEVINDICEFLGVSKLKEYSQTASNKGNLPDLNLCILYTHQIIFKTLRYFISKIPLLKK